VHIVSFEKAGGVEIDNESDGEYNLKFFNDCDFKNPLKAKIFDDAMFPIL
jgi:hypothetical protein